MATGEPTDRQLSHGLSHRQITESLERYAAASGLRIVDWKLNGDVLNVRVAAQVESVSFDVEFGNGGEG